MAAIEYLPADGTDWTAETFLENLRRSHEQWWRDRGRLGWVFRGHADAAWKLRPAAWRSKDEGNRLMPLIERRMHELGHSITANADAETRNTFLSCWIDAEARALYEFADLANSLGLSIKRLKSTWKNKHIIEKVYNIKDANYITQCVSLAQHHGIPTRLLDWTENPLYAAYFAAEYHIDNKLEADLAVWALNRDAVNIYKDIYCFVPERFSNPFLAAQSGVFTLMKGDEEFLDNGIWPDIETKVKIQNKNIFLLRKLVLPKREIKKLTDILHRERITKAQLMPSYDNVAKDVFNRWKMEIENCSL